MRRNEQQIAERQARFLKREERSRIAEERLRIAEEERLRREEQWELQRVERERLRIEANRILRISLAELREEHILDIEELRKKRRKKVNEMKKEAELILNKEFKHKDEKRILTNEDTERLTWKDDVPSKRLKERVMNWYFGMLQKRSMERHDLPNVFAMDVNYYQRLIDPERPNGPWDDIDDLATEMTEKIDVLKSEIRSHRSEKFKYDIILVPIAKDGHMSLCVLYPNKQLMELYDSQITPEQRKGNDTSVFNKIAYDLVGMSARRKGWETIFKTDCPQQTNTHDCNVFAMNIAYLICTKLPVRFTQANAKHLRQRILWEVYNNKIFDYK